MMSNFVKYGYADGDYHCICSKCGIEHIADKRALTCLKCAALQLQAENERLKEALKESEVEDV